ncbi:hypothetical protein DFJ74DRAFT_672668 [Hyaloraphidium curvatum]|nr:hypothetical protein DFJ74DRAFT_698087 [Hyaloraphidium curvatum]KAI9021355.1 hypothetical protein DFJ74DRAFT_672668 [Hyaloraphidium curvatum]
MSFWIIAEMSVKPGQKEAFEALMKELMTESLKEPGMLTYTLTQQAKNPKELASRTEPEKYFMVEHYKDRDAFVAHLKSPHFAKLGSKLGQYTTNGPMKFLTPLVDHKPKL